MFFPICPASLFFGWMRFLLQAALPFSHDNLTKPKDPPPSPNLVFLALAREADALKLVLLVEQYGVAEEAMARIRDLSQATKMLPDSTSPEERGRLAQEFHNALDGLMRHPETLEMEWDGNRWAVLPPCAPIQLCAGMKRAIPVIVRNLAALPMDLHWEAAASGHVHILAGGTARLFFELHSHADADSIPLRFSAPGTAPCSVTLPVRMQPEGRLQVRILDEMDQPVAARLYVTASDGRTHTQDGAIRRITDMGEYYYHVPSEFSLTLPAGEAKLEFVRGFEYLLHTARIDVKVDTVQEVIVRLQRWADMAARNWFSGDGHIHMHYGGTLRVLPEDVMLMLDAEDLNVGNMVVANAWGDDVFDREHFEGETNRLSRPKHILHWSEEFRNDFLGHLILYDLHALTNPVYTGFANTPHSHDFPLNADICDQTIAQGGVATGAHPFWGRAEHAIDVAIGKMAGIETAGYGALFSAGIQVLHGLWNCGFRTVATAGTDSFLNVIQRDPLGGARCYAYLEEPLSYKAWVKAMEAGRTFVTTAPMLFLTVNDQIPGGEIRLEGDRRTVHIEARAASPWPLTILEIFCNGEAVVRVRAEKDEKEILFSGDIDVSASGWIAAQCTGPHNRFIMGGSLFKHHAQIAHTSPVWIVVDGKPVPPSRDSVRFLKWVEDFTQLVEEKGKFENEEQRAHMREVYGDGRARFAELADQFRRYIQPTLVKHWRDEQGRIIEDFILQGEEPIPFVVMSDGQPGPKPVVFWQHGATGSRLVNLECMHRICDAGYLLVSVDQRLHGDRKAKMPPLHCGEEPRFEDTILYIACGTARDIRLVLDYLETRRDVIPERIGWTGGSLGGIVGTILATHEKRIKAVVSFIGGGAHRLLANHWAKGEALREETEALLRQYDPLANADRLFPTAILQYNGRKDDTCTPEAAQFFHDAVKPYYEKMPDRLQLIINPETGHMIPEEGWQAAMEWLRKFV